MARAATIPPSHYAATACALNSLPSDLDAVESGIWRRSCSFNPAAGWKANYWEPLEKFLV